ncbi:MAG: hypothetical protein VX335_03015 [Pseudomonadota bacterium]|nr:hypothetical protein [Pseudomonadota bacterium]
MSSVNEQLTTAILNADPKKTSYYLECGACANGYQSSLPLKPLMAATLAYIKVAHQNKEDAPIKLRKYAEIIKLLIAFGADINAKNDKNNTVVDVARSVKNHNLANLVSILEKPRNNNLFNAVKANSIPLLHLALNQPNFNINVKNSKKLTALSTAISSRLLRIATVLVDNGAKVTYMDIFTCQSVLEHLQKFQSKFIDTESQQDLLLEKNKLELLLEKLKFAKESQIRAKKTKFHIGYESNTVFIGNFFKVCDKEDSINFERPVCKINYTEKRTLSKIMSNF